MGDKFYADDLHEGILAYLYHKNHYQPLYSCITDMPAESAVVLQYCLSSDVAHNTSAQALSGLRNVTEKEWAALVPPGKERQTELELESIKSALYM